MEDEKGTYSLAQSWFSLFSFSSSLFSFQFETQHPGKIDIFSSQVKYFLRGVHLSSATIRLIRAS